MNLYHKYFDNAVNTVKAENRYRAFTTLSYRAGNLPYAHCTTLNKEIIVWCGNDYLGMSQSPSVIQKVISCVKKSGVGSGGTRNISGTSEAITALETEISQLHSKDSSLVFTSGYVANQASISTIAKIIPNLVIISDEFNHASMIHGIKEGRFEKRIYKHCDMVHLEAILQEYPIETPKMIAFESVYSMTGIISPMKHICDIAKKYNCMTYVDEVHAVGIYGKNGAGIAEQIGISQEIDIIQGTLSKGYGVIGGYIASSKPIVDAIRSYAPAFIFTAALPPSIASAAIESISYVRSHPQLREKHLRNTNQVKSMLRDAGINFIENSSHIIPIMVGDAVKCTKIREYLLQEHSIYLQDVNFPTVPRGTERLRVTPGPFHTEQMMKDFVNAVSQTLQKFEVNFKWQEQNTIAAA